MTRVALLILRWKVETRETLERAWESRWFGVAITSSFAIGIAYLLHAIPPPGICVAAMGVAAALMTGRGKATGTEKATWMLLISVLLVIEVIAIRKDRREHDESLARLLSEEVGARTEAKNNFTSIAQGIQATIDQSSQQFGKTMRRSDTIVSGVADSLKAQTGGDSFAFITLTPEPATVSINFGNFTSPPGVPFFLVSITSKGKYPLRSGHANMMDDERRLAAMNEYNKHPDGNGILAIQASDSYYQFPYLRPQSAEAPSGDVQMLGYYPMTSADSKRLTIAFGATNGYWNEVLHMGRANGMWHECLSVMGPTVKQAKHPFIYCDSNWPEGKKLAEKDWVFTPQKPKT